MTQPTPPYTQTDIDLVADTIVDARLRGHRDWTDRIARAVLDALTAAGRLQPAGATAAEQWAVRTRSVLDNGIGLPHVTRAEAEETIRRREAHRPRYPVTYELVRREVRRWPDGSVLVGAWTTPEVTA